MVIPQKHIKLSKSYLGYGAKILKILKTKNLTIDALWDKLSGEDDSIRNSYEDTIYTLDFLFAIKLIKTNEAGELCLN